MTVFDIIYQLSWQIFGPDCTKKILLEGAFFDSICMKLLISKLLSFGIIFGSIIVKFPQIAKIVNSKSVIGLSLAASVLETISSSISFAYNVRMNNPISTFGETLFISVQNFVISMLILVIQKRFVSSGFLLIAFVGLVGSLLVPGIIDLQFLTLLQTLSIPLYLVSRLPQIVINFKSSSTGQLSAISLFLIWAGSLARVFTTYQEVKDNLVLLGAVLAAVLNSILAAQMVLYWQKPQKLKVL